MSPPRMRGSTHARMRGRLHGRVSPAHAGIDLERDTGASRRSGLPRACGDRPFAARGDHLGHVSPPRMRGSTCHEPEGLVIVWVSPAHAGIDLAARVAGGGGDGLPRACGDRPHPHVAVCRADRSPPRMRGSTLYIATGTNHLLVSPAHAGIDPSHSLGGSFVWRLPRACGDRPGHRVAGSLQPVSPPRMRGSTLLEEGRRRCDRVSAAHAGIER